MTKYKKTQTIVCINYGTNANLYLFLPLPPEINVVNLCTGREGQISAQKH